MGTSVGGNLLKGNIRGKCVCVCVWAVLAETTYRVPPAGRLGAHVSPGGRGLGTVQTGSDQILGMGGSG